MIDTLEKELSEIMLALGLSYDDFEKFFEEEMAYFRDMSSNANPQSELKKQYVKALNEAVHWQYVINFS